MKQLGTYLADTLTEDGQISKEQQAIYAYLFDYLIEALLYDIVVLIIGLLVHRLDLTLCYLLVTIPLRHFAGGFMSNTRLGCTILSYGIYLITIFLCSLILKHIKTCLDIYPISAHLVYDTSGCTSRYKKQAFI